MRPINFIWIVICLLLGISCRNDDAQFEELWEYVNNMADRLARFEAWQEKVNQNLDVLQKLVNVSVEGKSITNVTDIGEGYRIEFSDTTFIVIRHGKKGENKIPTISLRDSSNGNFYWTVDGYLLKNREGEPVQANGQQGESGKDGATPQLRINKQTLIWEVSLDEGKQWESLGIKANGPQGEQGETLFAKDGIKLHEQYVEFKLADGTTLFRLPRISESSLYFPEGTSFIGLPGKNMEIPFVFTNTDSTGATVYATGNGGWTASIKITGTTEGQIILTPPTTLQCETTILIFQNNKNGTVKTYPLTLKMPPGEMIFVPGGNLDILGEQFYGWGIDDFWIGKTEVTCQQFCDFLNAMTPIPDTMLDNRLQTNGVHWFAMANWYHRYGDVKLLKHDMIEYSHPTGRWIPKIKEIHYKTGNRYESVADFPITAICWGGALAYCQWAGGDLPTEAQWEYAARGSILNPQAPTDIYAGDSDPFNTAWIDENSKEDGTPDLVWGLHRVASLQPNFLGIYDMVGNAAEWCKDEYDPTMRIWKPLNGSGTTGKTNPQGYFSNLPQEMKEYLVRGGNSITPYSPSVHTRHSIYYDYSRYNGSNLLMSEGFRLVYNSKLNVR